MSFFYVYSINYDMNLLEEIDGWVSKEYGITLNEYRLVNISGKALYIEGQTGINLMSEKEISFALKKKNLTIKGDNLTIKYFDKSTAVVVGHIVSTQIV